MDISKQVCLLEQAKQFKALGITNSYFVFNKYGEVEESWMHINEGDENIFYPALSVAELGAILQTKANNCFSLKGSEWITNLVPSPVYSTQAACYGAYLLHCFSMGYITQKEANERLSLFNSTDGLTIFEKATKSKEAAQQFLKDSGITDIMKDE